MNQLAAITIVRNDDLIRLNKTAFRDFTNWSKITGSIVSQTSSQFTVGGISPVINSGAFSPAVTNAYGTDFLVIFGIQIFNNYVGSTITVSGYLYNSGVPVGFTADSVDVTPDGDAVLCVLGFDTTGIVFDSVRLTNISNDGQAHDFKYYGVDIAAISYPAFPDFNTGDRIIISWDGAAIVVQREDNPGGALTTITDGPDFDNLLNSQVTGVVNIPFLFNGVLIGGPFWRSLYQFCDSTDLQQFYFGNVDNVSGFIHNEFPYVLQFSTPDAAECTIVGTVCDVHFTAQPAITGTSNPFAADGAVTIVAESSHGSCKYSTDPPTTTAGQYANVSNSTGIFTGLATGTYVYYAVDQYGCSASITVVIPVTDALVTGTKYRLQYYDVMTHKQSIIDIEERNYTGDIIYVQGTGDPLALSKNNGELNNKFDAIRATFANVNLNSERHFQFLLLFSQDDRKYKLKFTHDSILKWRGYLYPSAYSESYSPSVNYPVNLKFGDIIASLADYDFVDDSGNGIFNTLSIISIFSVILRKLNLNLDIVSAVNKFSKGMATTASDDPLAQAYLDCSVFYDDEGIPKKCDEVLASILKAFGAFIIQKDAQWHIVEVDSQKTSYTYRKFDYLGVYSSNGTINPIINIDRPYVTLENVLLSGGDHTLDIIPAYGVITLTHSFRPKSSIYPLSLNNGWITNAYNSAAYAGPYSKPESNNRGMEFLNLTNDRLTFLSPFFVLTTFSDSLKIDFSYLIKMQTYGSFTDPFTSTTYNGLNLPSAPWVRIGWRVLLTYNSVDYYFHEVAGWNRLDVVGTSTSSVAIPTSHATSKSLTISTGLTLSPGRVVKIQNDSTHYFRATVTSYDQFSGALVVSSYANVGTGTFTSWNIYSAGDGFDINYFFSSNYSEFQTFSKAIDLPNFIEVSEISLQVQIVWQGTIYKDFTDLTSLRAIPTSIYPEGFQIAGVDPSNSYYTRWYKLRQGTDSDNGTSIIRGTDYNGTSNAVVWDSDGFDAFKYVNVIAAIQLQDVFVSVLPNKLKATEEETLIYTNDINYKEKLDYEISIGDLPTSLVNKEIYLGILKLSDGTPTSSWTRRDTSEQGTLQELLLTSLYNQYRVPSWRLSGTFLAPNIEFDSIIKQIIKGLPFTITNPENPNGTGWSQFGAGQAWSGTSGYCAVQFDGSHTGNSAAVRQPQTVNAGTKIQISFSFLRMSTSGSRIDRFVCVMFRGSSIVQKITLYDGITGDVSNSDSLEFYVDSDFTFIGFFIENISGTGTCEYRVDYFRGVGVDTVKYYFVNQLSRSDKHNAYKAELMELL